MVGDPPIGTEDTIRPFDRDDTVEERRAREAGQYPVGEMVPGRNTAMPATSDTPAMPTDSADALARAEAVVRREGGVSDFAQADATDAAPGYRVEDFPGQDSPEVFNDPERDASRRDGDIAPGSAADAAGRAVADVPIIARGDGGQLPR